VWRSHLKTTHESYADFMYVKLAEHTANDSEELKRIKYALMKRLLIAETVESGSKDMTEVSLNEYGSYEIPIGPDYEFPGGYGQLAQFLADKLPSDSIRLKHPVKHVELGNDKALPMIVSCVNGVRYRAKHVVCTVSSAYLKQHYK
jgi:protoporphyrinogen oxidase